MIFSPEQIHLKGWGYEYWIVNSEKYCGKMLVFECGKRCSWHYHKIKDETFFVQKGHFIVLTSYDDDIDTACVNNLYPGNSLHIPVGMRHQIIAVTDSTLYEFSTQHFEEDSYRIKKGD